ncbi:helix-turn-helix domain-containing protein [Frigoribacterium faeni]|nr:helix-turn-helix domain-containing protein [Frigoribacterium faeni]
MAISDTQIGRNLARLRGQMTQKELAEAMSSRGWKWSQTTVHTVEQGKRPLRLAESEDIKEIIGTAWPLTLADGDTALVSASRRMKDAHQSLEEAIELFLDTQEEISAILGDGESDRVRELMGGWLDLTVEATVEHVRKRRALQNEAENALWDDNKAEDGKHPEAP